MDAGIQCRDVTRIIFASDDDDLLEIVDSGGFDKVETYRRSDASADSECTQMVVVGEWCERQGDSLKDGDILVLQEATFPFTKPSDLSNAYRLLVDNNADCIRSVGARTVFAMFHDGTFINSETIRSSKRTQNFEDEDKIWCINGCLRMAKIELWKEAYWTNQRGWIPKPNAGNLLYKMRDEPFCTADIDSELDFLICETMMKSWNSINK